MQTIRSNENVQGHRTEFWGICCESGKNYSQIVRQKFHVSMAALDPSVEPTSEFVSLMVEHGGSHYLLCSLEQKSKQQVNLDLFFDAGEEITFTLKGLGTVHLTGYYVCDDESPGVKNDITAKPSPTKKAITPAIFKSSNAVKPLKAPFKESSSSDEESSDSSLNAETEKVESPAKKNSLSPVKKKLIKVSKNMEISLEDSTEEGGIVAKVDKVPMNNKNAIKKKQSTLTSKPLKNVMKTDKTNKQKVEVVSDEDSSLEDDEDDDFDIDESEGDDDNGVDGNQLKTFATKRYRQSLEDESSDDDDDDDDDDDSSDENAVAKTELTKTAKGMLQNAKKMKLSPSTPTAGNKLPAKAANKKIGGVIDLDDDMNSSIGHTPMPKKQKPSSPLKLNNTVELKKGNQNKTPKKESPSGEKDSDVGGSPLKKTTPVDLNASNQSLTSSSKKKKKRRKSKAAANESNAATPTTGSPASKYSQKLPSGVEFEDVRHGNGLIAKKGKLVHVFYTGKLENNQMFDSRQQGSKPFSFKLGSGQVIKGWDLGLEGMKVGGKRRLKIPAHLAYGEKRTGTIPPKSTLYFDVELKAVS